MVVVVKTILIKSRMLPARDGREEGMLSDLWAHSQFVEDEAIPERTYHEHHLMLPSIVL